MKNRLSFFGAVALLLNSSLALSQVLDVPQIYQEKGSWCWAAVSQAVLEYYGIKETQTTIAEYGAEGLDIPNSLSGSFTDPTRRGVDLILEHFGNITSQYHTIFLDSTVIKHEIQAGRPIPITFQFTNGNSHLLLIHGYVDGMVYLMDPWLGPSINDYAWVRRSDDHEWLESLTLLTNPTTVDHGPIPIPETTSLEQNYPNPFNTETSIKYRISKPGRVEIIVYDVTGKRIETLVDGYRTNGEHQIQWQTGALPSGVYYYRLQSDGFSETRKLILAK